MDDKIVETIVQAAVTYIAYLFMTTSESDMVRARAGAYRKAARGSQKVAETFGRLGIAAEHRATELLS